MWHGQKNKADVFQTQQTIFQLFLSFQNYMAPLTILNIHELDIIVFKVYYTTDHAVAESIMTWQLNHHHTDQQP